MYSFLHSREGVIQGDPLALVANRIGFLPLIKRLKAEYPEFTQTWFNRNAGAIGAFDNIELYFN